MAPLRTAELLAVGTELLLGEVIDTNTAFLAASLAELGIDVYWSQRVGDNLERLRRAITQALGRSDLLVITGGLGPTDDDLTREAIAAVAGEEPAVSPQLEAALRRRFAESGRDMPASNLKQAWLIPSAEALTNRWGTAPGWLARPPGAPGRVIVALPGPPRELQPMWREQALPRLELPRSALYLRTFKTYGLGESHIAELLADLTASGNPSVATYARSDGVHVRLAAKAEEAAAAAGLAAEAQRVIEERLGEAVWGVDGDELPQLVLAAAARSGSRVASAELGAGGSLAQALSGVSGDNGAYLGGVIACSLQATGALPWLRPQISGPAAPEMAADLAAAVRRGLAAEIGVATAVEEAAPGNRGQARRRAAAAVDIAGQIAVRQLDLPPLPEDWLRERVALAALHLLWSKLR